MHFIKFASLGIFNAHFLLILETPYGYRVDEGVYDMKGVGMVYMLIQYIKIGAKESTHYFGRLLHKIFLFL